MPEEEKALPAAHRILKPDFSGRWQGDLSRSRLLGPSPKAMTVTITHSEPQLTQTIIITKEDGNEQRISFKCVTNGELDQCEFDGNKVQGAAHWQNQMLVIELWMQQGGEEFYLCDCWSLSPDGHTLTMEHRADALAGQVAVLHRID